MDNTTNGRVRRVMQWLEVEMDGHQTYEAVLKELQKKLERIVGSVDGRNYRAPNPETLIDIDVFDYIVDKVSNYYSAAKNLLMSRKKGAAIGKPRKVMHFLALTISGRSQMDCARYYGRERTSLIYSRDAVRKRMRIDKAYREEIGWLEQDVLAYMRRRNRERREELQKTANNLVTTVDSVDKAG